MPALSPARLARLLPLFLLLAACVSAGPHRTRLREDRDGAAGPRILVVTAHPDDETAFSGTLYKATTYLDAVCDAVVITNGEGGFKYATLAERTYGLELTLEEVGRRHLPRIRSDEMLAAASLLELRDVHLLSQTDHRYTQDVGEVLGAEDGPWDLALVRSYLRELMEAEHYDFVLTLAPTPTTHGHHQAAGLLAVEAASTLPADLQPVCLAVQVAAEPDLPAPITIAHPDAALQPGPPLIFDRAQRFGHRDRLDYRILVNQVIAAHHSQGTMQLAVNGGPLERFFLFAANPPDARERAGALFEALRGDQFPLRNYGASAGTNAGAR